MPANQAKVYCTCPNPYATGYYGLFKAGPSKRGHYVFVHSCGKPAIMVWQAWIQQCDSCLTLFSSPWETECRACKLNEYMGWRWARQLDSHSKDSDRKKA